MEAYEKYTQKGKGKVKQYLIQGVSLLRGTCQRRPKGAAYDGKLG